VGYLLLAAFLGSGCLTVVSDQAPPAPTTGGLPAGGGPQVSCVPTVLIFPPTAQGRSATVPVYCTNVGSAASGVNLMIALGGTGSSLFTAQFGQGGFPPAGLSPNQSVAVDVTYTPGGISADNGQLVLDTNAGTVTIPMFGEGLNYSCQLKIPTQALDFGKVAIGAAPPTASFAVDNAGFSQCAIRGPIAIENDPSKSFHVVSTSIMEDGQTGDYTLQPVGSSDAHLVITVEFQPTTTGQLAAEVADFIGLTGTGVAPP